MYCGGQTSSFLQFPHCLVQFSIEIQCNYCSDSSLSFRHRNVQFKTLIHQPFLIRSWSISVELLYLTILSLDTALLSCSPASFLICLPSIHPTTPFLFVSHNSTAWRDPPALWGLLTPPMEPPLLPPSDLTTHRSHPSCGCYLWSHLGVFPTPSCLLHWAANSMFLDLWLKEFPHLLHS